MYIPCTSHMYIPCTSYLNETVETSRSVNRKSLVQTMKMQGAMSGVENSCTEGVWRPKHCVEVWGF